MLLLIIGRAGSPDGDPRANCREIHPKLGTYSNSAFLRDILKYCREINYRVQGIMNVKPLLR